MSAPHRHRLKGQARRSTSDLDPTDDPTHGQQAWTFCNGPYDSWCDLPLVATRTFNNEADQYLVAGVWRPGNSPAKHGAFGLLRTLRRRLRRAFPGTPRRGRVDGGCAGNDWLDCLEAERVESVVGLARNPRRERRAGRVLGEAYGLSQYSGRTEHVYGEPRSAAQSWSHRRRVISKAEVVRLPGRDPTCNPRFVVTNLRETPAGVSAVSCQRGDMENRLKELHQGLALDRTSGSQCWANQFRVLLTAAASVLLQALRHQAHGTACARAQVSTLRERLLKLAVWVERSVRRIVRHLPRTAPWGTTWQRVAVAVGAVPGSRHTQARAGRWRRGISQDTCVVNLPCRTCNAHRTAFNIERGAPPPLSATATGAQESPTYPEWHPLTL